MIKELSLCAGILLLTLNPVYADQPNIINGCTSKDTIEKFLNDNEFVTFVRGTGSSGKINEVWINSKSYIVTIAYDRPTDNKAENIKEVCVVNMMKNAIYNGDTVETLGKSLEKASPKL